MADNRVGSAACNDCQLDSPSSKRAAGHHPAVARVTAFCWKHLLTTLIRHPIALCLVRRWQDCQLQCLFQWFMKCEFQQAPGTLDPANVGDSGLLRCWPWWLWDAWLTFLLQMEKSLKVLNSMLHVFLQRAAVHSETLLIYCKPRKI